MVEDIESSGESGASATGPASRAHSLRQQIADMEGKLLRSQKGVEEAEVELQRLTSLGCELQPEQRDSMRDKLAIQTEHLRKKKVQLEQREKILRTLRGNLEVATRKAHKVDQEAGRVRQLVTEARDEAQQRG